MRVLQICDLFCRPSWDTDLSNEIRSDQIWFDLFYKCLLQAVARSTPVEKHAWTFLLYELTECAMTLKFLADIKPLKTQAQIKEHNTFWCRCSVLVSGIQLQAKVPSLSIKELHLFRRRYYHPFLLFHTFRFRSLLTTLPKGFYSCKDWWACREGCLIIAIFFSHFWHEEKIFKREERCEVNQWWGSRDEVRMRRFRWKMQRGLMR